MNDNVTTDLHELPGDMRRAGALLAHHAANSRIGCAAVLDEAEELGRLRQLAYALPAVFGAVQPDWHSDATAAVMRSFTEAFLARENQDGTDV